MHPILPIAALITGVTASPHPPSTNSKTTTVTKRQDWDDWPRCTTRPAGECTLYIATGKPEYHIDVPSPYRNFALFDENCELIQFLESTADSPWILLQGYLEETVALIIDEGVEPKGNIHYGDDGATDLGDLLECRDWEELDGVGCRTSFPCQEGE